MTSLAPSERTWLRVELVSMDGQCADISIALYRQETEVGPVGIVHTYSRVAGAAERVAFVAAAMRTLGGLARAGDDSATIAFTCGTWHPAVARRLFLEAVKIDQTGPVEVRPLEIVDRKTGQTLTVEPTGAATYRISASETGDAASRAPAVARGLRKLAELADSDDETAIEFACGHDHAAVVGLLLPRAVNVREAIREEELNAGRGMLTAPGASE
jgi:hypothetical protein